MSLIITEEDALKKLNDPDSNLTLNEAHTIISSLQKSINDRYAALERKIIGPASYYEGEYTALRIAEKILQKLNTNEKED